MANFQSVPGGKRTSGQVLIVTPPSMTIGLWGYLASPGNELVVTSSNPRVTVKRGGLAGNVRLWVITGAAGQDTGLEAGPAGGGTWDTMEVHFRAGKHQGGAIEVRSIVEGLTGTSPADHLVPGKLSKHEIIKMSSFKAGDPANILDFASQASCNVRIGMFAAKHGGVERAAILMLPETGSPDRVLVGITHVFGQSKENRAYYGALHWSDPLSPKLIQTVLTHFVINRWGPQVMASKKKMAFVLPVRAQGDELGPFRDGAFIREVLESMSQATSRAFTYQHVEMFCFSSGINDLNNVLPSVRGNLNLEAVYNLDPSGGTPAQFGGVRKQFLSGYTTHGQARGGFEFLPFSRWAGEQDWADVDSRNSSSVGDYLHNGVLPGYCLYLGIQLS